MLPIRSNIEVKPNMIYKWIELVTWGRCINESMTPIDKLALVNSFVLDIGIEWVSHFG
jgi:hypothetical protein